MGIGKKALVRELMMRDIKTVRPERSIAEVSRYMAKHNIGAVMVIDKDRKILGIFTERDLLKKVVAKSVDLASPVSTVMTKDLVCAQLHDEIDVIPDMMVNGGFRHVPVVDGFEPVGILSIRDVLAYLLSLNPKQKKVKAS